MKSKSPIAYFEATYIGRCLPAGRRRPLFEHQWWDVGDRMTTGLLRANSAIESFRIASSRGIAQADHPTVYRFLEALNLHQNITCGARDIAPYNPNRSRNRRTRRRTPEECRKAVNGKERAHHESRSTIRRASRQRAIPPRSSMELYVSSDE